MRVFFHQAFLPFVLSFVVLTCLGNQAIAQIVQIYPYELQKNPKFSALAGYEICVANKTGYNDQFYLASLAYHLGSWHQIGIIYGYYVPSLKQPPSVQTAAGSHELGLQFKFQIHGNLSGLRSNYFLGMECRKSIDLKQHFYFPNSPVLVATKYVNNIRACMLLGMNLKIGHLLFEVGTPVGIIMTNRYSKNSTDFIFNPENKTLRYYATYNLLIAAGYTF